MIRRLKKDVLKQLPPKIRTKVNVATDSKIRRQIAFILKRDLNNAKERKMLEDAISKRN
jgi:SNF2 family DNA or RNA helicase